MNTQRIEITTANFEPVIKHLTNAINWLNSDQIESAVMSHHGIYLRAPEIEDVQLGISLAPVAAGGHPVLVFSKPYIEDKTSVTGMSSDCFTASEIEVIRQGIASAGGKILDEWNGLGHDLASFSLAQFATEGVSRLVRNYTQHMNRYGFSWPNEVRSSYDLAVKPEYWF